MIRFLTKNNGMIPRSNTSFGLTSFLYAKVTWERVVEYVDININFGRIPLQRF